MFFPISEHITVNSAPGSFQKFWSYFLETDKTNDLRLLKISLLVLQIVSSFFSPLN